jgi:hypothetical protein
VKRRIEIITIEKLLSFLFFLWMENVFYSGWRDVGRRTKNCDVFYDGVEDVPLFDGEVNNGKANTSDRTC